MAVFPWTLIGAEKIEEIDWVERERRERNITENLTDTEAVSRYEKFRLWNDCGLVSLVVERLHDDAKKMGITEDRIQNTVESRLRGGRIYGESGPPFVYINVNIMGAVVSIRLEFRPAVIRSGFEHVGFAPTWYIFSIGTFRENAGYAIIQTVAEYTDKFINEYLRVNAPACKL